MSKIISCLAICFIFLSLNASASLSQFEGTWTNIDPNTRGIPMLDISVSGSSASVHSWGACSPTPCDWGTVNADAFAPDVSSDISSSAEALVAVFDAGFSVTTMVITPSGDMLNVDSYTRFTDSSGRSNYANHYTFQHGGGAPAGLTAPVQDSPASGSVFNSYPRTTTLSWEPVPGAASYTVEVDCYGCCQNSRWCTDAGRTWDVVPGVTDTSYTFDFVGAQPGRWRVWAVDASGNEGPKSDWWNFRYTR
jgi:hypothetical protein